MSKQETAVQVKFIQPQYAEGQALQGEYLVTGEIKTDAGAYIFNAPFSDEEKAEFNSLMDKVIQRVKQNIRDAV